jgi:hypothetical protein
MSLLNVGEKGSLYPATLEYLVGGERRSWLTYDSDAKEHVEIKMIRIDFPIWLAIIQPSQLSVAHYQ